MKTHKIEAQETFFTILERLEEDNEHFSVTYNEELDCFDMVMKKAEYKTSSELLGILSFVHQISGKLRIGAQIEI